MTRKEYRIKWIGFDDLRFMLIGIPLLAVVANALNHETKIAGSAVETFIYYLISLSYCTLNWIGFRKIAVECRKKYSELKTERKRITAMILVSLTFFFFFNPLWTVILQNALSLAPLNSSIQNFGTSNNLAAPFVLSVMMIAIYEVIYFNMRLSQSEKLREQTKAANTLSQLNVLKNQSKPHFLFNSLNTLRYMISTGPVDKAEQFVDQLASVYRYIISMGEENLIPLSEELNFIESYLFIQNERFGDNLKVNLDISGEYLHMQVAPMSIQQLIENAIKHNVVSSKRPLHIDVFIETINSTNFIVISNDKALKTAPVTTTKTGLKNIKTRYDLLSEERVEVIDSDHKFEVKIPLLMSSQMVNAYL